MKGKSTPPSVARQTKNAFLHWYKWYPRDFAASEEAAALTLAEEGAVRRLFDHQWIHGSIPAELDQLANLCRVSSAEMAMLWKRAGIFFVQTKNPARLSNARLQREYESAIKGKKLLSSAGRRGAARRWGGYEGANGADKASASDSKRLRKPDADADAKTENPLKGAGMLVFSKVRNARVAVRTPNGTTYHLPPEFLKGLDDVTRRTIEAVGGGGVVASADGHELRVLRSQFADIYRAAIAEGEAKGKERSTDHESAVQAEVHVTAEDRR
jgi:hypothetical protein